ncbi:hypothetical protein TWF679_001761 [Orbilia oligospora]|uniref:Uncharacterized protein n=1 Tax=Orbilia oligospora TaxID=2813651 RepID=A0A8H8UUV5_ORBOL|nr:hypothetical protein TWF679_001761 [Orbilia oligospora]
MSVEHQPFISLHDAANPFCLTHKSSHKHPQRNGTIGIIDHDHGLRPANMHNMVDVQDSPQNHPSDPPSLNLPETGSTEGMDWQSAFPFLSPPIGSGTVEADNTIVDANQYFNDGYWGREILDSVSRVDSRSTVEGQDNMFVSPSGPDPSSPAQDIDSHRLEAQDRIPDPATDLLRPISVQDTNLPEQQLPTPDSSFGHPMEKPASAGKRQKPIQRACREFSKGGCDLVFSSERELGRHLWELHSIKAFRCPNKGCIYRASRKDNVDAHWKKCKCGTQSSSSTSTIAKCIRRSPPATLHSQPEMFAKRPGFAQSAPLSIHQLLQDAEIPVPFPPASSPLGALPLPQSQREEPSLINNAPFISLGNGNSIAINTQVPPSSPQPEPHISPGQPLRDPLERENARLRAEMVGVIKE